MSLTIQIPTPLRRFTGERGEVQVEGATVGEALRSLVAAHGALGPHLYTEEGKLRSFVNLFLNDEDVRYLKQESTPVAEGDTLSIIPSIAGGGPRRARLGSAQTRTGGGPRRTRLGSAQTRTGRGRGSR